MIRDRDRGASLVDTDRQAAAQLWTRLGASFGACAGPVQEGLVDPPSLQVRGNKAARQRCVSVYAHVTCRLPRNFISCACARACTPMQPLTANGRRRGPFLSPPFFSPSNPFSSPLQQVSDKAPLGSQIPTTLQRAGVTSLIPRKLGEWVTMLDLFLLDCRHCRPDDGRVGKAQSILGTQSNGGVTRQR